MERDERDARRVHCEQRRTPATRSSTGADGTVLVLSGLRLERAAKARLIAALLRRSGRDSMLMRADGSRDMSGMSLLYDLRGSG